MILAKSKIYELRIITFELKDKKIREIYLANNQNKDWNRGMESAALGGHEKLVYFFIRQGAYRWNRGMESAALGGHEKLVHFFISKGANDWNWGMVYATQEDYKKLMNFLRKIKLKNN